MAEYALQASWTCSGCGRSSNVPQQQGTNAQALGQRCVRLAREQGWRIPYGGTGGTFCPRCNSTCNCDGDDGETGHDGYCPRLSTSPGTRSS